MLTILFISPEETCILFLDFHLYLENEWRFLHEKSTFWIKMYHRLLWKYLAKDKLKKCWKYKENAALLTSDLNNKRESAFYQL